MSLRRGFKAEANRTAREVRLELGLPEYAPLNPFNLADNLGVNLLKLSDFVSVLPNEANHLMQDGRNEFSAVTLCNVTPRIIIYNDAHSLGRQAANIAHELAHLLLLHSPHRLTSDSGGRHFDQELEDEANWMGPALLVSDEAAIHVIRNGWSLSDAAEMYGVSAELMRMRLSVTGARNRVQRGRKK